jgi:signal transduction histidine kinase
MHLRHIVTLLTTLLVIAAVASSGSLITITSFLHEQTNSIENNLESVRSIEEIELALLWHARHSHLAALTGEPVHLDAARKADDEAHGWYASARRYVGDPAEQSAFDSLGASIDEYFTEHESFAGLGLSAGEAYLQASATLGQAYADAEEVLRINLGQAAASAKRARDWNAIANWLGSSIALMLLGSVAIVIAGARAQVYRPLLALREAITRLGDRERSARAAETGAPEIRQIARSFNEMADALQRHHRTQVSFVAGIAHDLRNPLAVMKAALSTIPNDLGRYDEHLAKTVVLISRQVDLSVRMISDFLDISRIEAGQLKLSREKCDARLVVVHAVELFRAASPAHELIPDLPSESVTVIWDALRMEQVVNNLVSNAIKYSPAGGRVEVGIEHQGSEILLQVRDHGIGIPPDEQRAIFEPFHRGKSSRETIAGVGLGLATARRIVEAHGGRIELASELGNGSMFSVYVPVCAERLHEGTRSSIR